MSNIQNLLCAELKRQLDGKGVCSKVSIPPGGELLWRWFLDLSATRTYHAAGPNPISYGEVEAYRRLTGWPLEPRHVAIIMAMDEVFVSHVHKRSTPPPEGVKTMVPVSATPMTAGRFDAMFG